MNHHDITPMNENTVWHYYFDNGSGEFLCDGWAGNIVRDAERGLQAAVRFEPFRESWGSLCPRCLDGAERLRALGLLRSEGHQG